MVGEYSTPLKKLFEHWAHCTAKEQSFVEIAVGPYLLNGTSSAHIVLQKDQLLSSLLYCIVWDDEAHLKVVKTGKLYECKFGYGRTVIDVQLVHKFDAHVCA